MYWVFAAHGFKFILSVYWEYLLHMDVCTLLFASLSAQSGWPWHSPSSMAAPLPSPVSMAAQGLYVTLQMQISHWFGLLPLPTLQACRTSKRWLSSHTPAPGKRRTSLEFQTGQFAGQREASDLSDGICIRDPWGYEVMLFEGQATTCIANAVLIPAVSLQGICAVVHVSGLAFSRSWLLRIS